MGEDFAAGVTDDLRNVKLVKVAHDYSGHSK
jgi:hypothetical protein